MEDNSLHEYSPIDMYAKQLLEQEKLEKKEKETMKAKPIPPKNKQNLAPLKGEPEKGKKGGLNPIGKK